MARTKIDGHEQIQSETIDELEIRNQGIWAEDLNTTSTGHAVIIRLFSSTGLALQSTGVDSGTGTVTLAVSTGYIQLVHRPIDQLVHAIAETAYYEVTRVAGKVTQETFWTNSGKTTKIREIDYTYAGALVTQMVTKQYDSLGNLIIGETLTETINRTGVNVDSITSVLS